MRKTIILYTFLLGMFVVNTVFAVTVDGFCYLEGATSHEGTKVLFLAVSPSAITDSTYTAVDGSYIIQISAGIYTVHYSHEGWQTYSMQNLLISEDTSLDDVTLLYGIILEVSGAQSGVWYPCFQYHVIGDVSVNNVDTLIINPGVIIKFMGFYEFSVYGTLISVGIETDSIRFTSGQSPSSPGDWIQIKFNDISSPNSVISYAIIEYSEVGIYCESSNPTISNNTFCNNYVSIHCINSAFPLIDNNTMINNIGAAINCVYSSSPNISNNSIIFTNFYGIDCRINSSPIIHNNVIYNGNNIGIYCFDSSSPNISDNKIFNNMESGILCDSSSPIINKNTIYNNYHGIECSYSSLPLIKNNTISNNLCNGIHCVDYSSPLILNNIIYYNDNGIDINSSPSALDYNLFWLNNNAGIGSGLPLAFGEIIIVNANGDSCDTYYNLFMDPLFVDPQYSNYHLTGDSPCIDAGNPDPTYYDPDGTISDIGAYYFDQSIIELTSFTATYDATYDCILICWITAWEIDVVGFNIYRNTEDDFEIANQLNFALIPGHGTTTVPHEYEFLDDTADVDSTYYYWLEVLDIGGLTYVYGSTVYEPPVGVDDYNSPNTFCLYQNYPNPFSSSTIISFRLKEISHIKLSIYNVKGQLVETLVNEDKHVGYHTVEWDSEDMSTGVYFFKLSTKDNTFINKMILMR